MSEVINNREYRQKVLKELIMELHQGQDVEAVQERFSQLIAGVTAAEISEMEQNLIMEGMPVQEVQRLCDVHAAVFKGTLEGLHHPEQMPGHPVYVFKEENREIERLVDEGLRPLLLKLRSDDSPEIIAKLQEKIRLLWEIDKHYSRKENLLFPYLEKHGITAPPKVMWGVDDEIRAGIKWIRQKVHQNKCNKVELFQGVDEVTHKITEMVFKEENILFPMALENLAQHEWVKIAEEGSEIGYCLIKAPEPWSPFASEGLEEHLEDAVAEGHIKFATGCISIKELESSLNHLPFDLTFIDSNDLVKYFSQGKERIFARTKAIIGRSVQNCHPPASAHIVEKLLEDFKAGEKEQEDFWIRMGEQYIYIRYFAVRDSQGEYLGTLEVTQNIKPIQEIQGEKRLLSDYL